MQQGDKTRAVWRVAALLCALTQPLVLASVAAAQTVTPIADIQANPSAFTIVTVEGQVYIPANYRGGTVYSCYIQDNSGRGINLFGSSANNPILNDVGNIVRVTGTVDVYFTTVEITSLANVTLVSSGNPPREPQQLSTGAAASSAWEGTFIEVTGTITAVTPSGPGTNYTVNDGSGAVDVRVVDNLGVAAFSNGQAITARGAGGQFQTTYQILVGRVADVFTAGGDTTPPTLTGATANSATQVTVTFSEAVSAGTAAVAGNYSVYETATPANSVAVTGATLATNQNVTLTLGSSLQSGVGYTVRVNNVQDLAGNTIAANSTRTFTYTAVQVTPIATIQANPSSYDGQVVTVEGQVYVPANYRSPTYSGYIQDSSDRGINLFGSSANNPILNDVGNIVRVTGTVDVYFTTVEITSLTNVTLVSSGNPPLEPQQLATGAAASSAWEGTFIAVTGTITAVTPSGPGTNYTVNDGSGAVDVRVVDNLGVAAFSNGQVITARGAGGQFQTTYQILVGRAADVFTAGGDTTPPTLTGATANSATQVTVTFSEAVTPATAEVTSNYAVLETATPANVIPVSGATLAPGSAQVVTLALGGSLQNGIGYTVRVSNVQDVAGNTITPNSTRTFTYGGVQVTPIASIQANPATYDGQVVTVEGQVYVPANYRAPTYSGYIQDGSDRGINLFGSTANNPILNDIGNIVRVTGTVDVYFTTVEITSLTNVTLVSSGNPPLEPQQLATGAAASSAWEGTFIEVTGTITAVTPSGPGTNYTVNDGSGAVDVRVVSNLGAAAFTLGQAITARGAGGQFQTTYQILVGRAADVFASTVPVGPVSVSLSGPPYTFVPTVGETYPITFTVPPTRLATSEILLRIFDLQGRLRRTLADSRFPPVLPKVQWNGRDDATELVPAGTYIVHLLVTDTKTGGRESLQMPVVVATRLNR